eukprot:8406824-Prorocentrum_lima.AAC.1
MKAQAEAAYSQWARAQAAKEQEAQEARQAETTLRARMERLSVETLARLSEKEQATGRLEQ